MNTISNETCFAALSGAALARRSAFQTELAVGFAIFLMQGNTDRQAKQMLNEAYASAGSQCLTADGVDYKTINRRINATADLFNTVKLKTVKQWAGKSNDDLLLSAMIEGLKPYELFTVSDVQRYCESKAPQVVKSESQPAATAKKDEAKVKPHDDILRGPSSNHTGQEKVQNMMRRATDQVMQGAAHIETDHLVLAIPKETTAAEMIEMAHKLLTLARERAQGATEKKPAGRKAAQSA